MYDPVLGRFLSPDPYVQFPESTQGFNRYTYVNNNPLSYVDPSGYFSLKKAFKGIGKWFNRVVKNVGQWGARLGKKVWGVIKPYVGMIAAMIPIPGLNIAIMAALGAGLQTAINGGSMEQVFIAAALGFTAGYAGSIIGADKLAHAMSGQPLFATGSAPGVLSIRALEGRGSRLARLWPTIAANFGTKMAEGMGDGHHRYDSKGEFSTPTEKQQRLERAFTGSARREVDKMIAEGRIPAPAENYSVKPVRYDPSDIKTPDGSYLGGTNLRDAFNAGDIVVYSPGARSIGAAVETYAHELGHFNNEWTHPQVYEYGRAVRRVFEGGSYEGPKP